MSALTSEASILVGRPEAIHGSPNGIENALVRRRLDSHAQRTDMFFFFSNRLGCLGSIAVSIILSLILAAVMYSCSLRGP
jgi:hypothetical protein